ncbi:UDP pyrophosphate phosphatase [Duganella sp. Leaf61]|uniref:undecaprenyl-diphosphate phosphatase n=1 Tax=Duganella sp. Leaf61 TaxID=1736227 RepID=UPI0006FB55D1|nr:undecaprenyl-diphosphate phosphatase [Duganella sp. Leaf61]KQN79546.1 UDP pyrophosphate phosphatase [Duganella sp. Leaf61]
MDIVLVIKAIIMGVVEGLTEFLPISSTGHLILTEHLLGFAGMEDKMKVFEIVIQAGAMMAVIWEFRARIGLVLSGIFSDPVQQRFALNVLIAFLPAAILGLIFASSIKKHLFAPTPVAAAFIIGGFIILWVEKRAKDNPAVERITSLDQITPVDALKIGIAQAFALIPGTSRSGATIMGSMIFGFSRKVATEFSFFLAIPTLVGATVYSLYKDRALLSMDDVSFFTIGTVSAFISAFLCIRWLLRYIMTHTFVIFAWYRIVFGLIVLITGYYGVIVWADK